MMENDNVLTKKVHIKRQSKNLHIARNEGFQFAY